MTPHPLVPPQAGVAGTGYDVKFFPDSSPGGSGPFAVPPPVKPPPPPPPPAPLPPGHFQAWVDFYVKSIGAALEKLNAIQFDLDKNPGQKKQELIAGLAALAQELKVGVGNNPKELRWPLAGSYTFQLGDAQGKGFDGFTLDLYFEDDPDYRMVVNCTLEINAHEAGPGQPNSSSSSYIATSSSG